MPPWLWPLLLIGGGGFALDKLLSSIVPSADARLAGEQEQTRRVQQAETNKARAILAQKQRATTSQTSRRQERLTSATPEDALTNVLRGLTGGVMPEAGVESEADEEDVLSTPGAQGQDIVPREDTSGISALLRILKTQPDRGMAMNRALGRSV